MPLAELSSTLQPFFISTQWKRPSQYISSCIQGVAALCDNMVSTADLYSIAVTNTVCTHPGVLPGIKFRCMGHVKPACKSIEQDPSYSLKAERPVPTCKHKGSLLSITCLHVHAAHHEHPRQLEHALIVDDVLSGSFTTHQEACTNPSVPDKSPDGATAALRKVIVKQAPIMHADAFMCCGSATIQIWLCQR